MKHINVEIKAKCFHLKKVEAFLVNNGARFVGTDYQKDTYFNVPDGRFKLRRGNIENSLIFYKRNNQPGPKQSDFHLVKFEDGKALEQLLTEALGIKVVVEKKRSIYYLDNVKIHLDELEGLGTFVEIEASSINAADKTIDDLRKQCEALIATFDIKEQDLIHNSYSDILLGE